MVGDNAGVTGAVSWMFHDAEVGVMEVWSETNIQLLILLEDLSSRECLDGR